MVAGVVVEIEAVTLLRPFFMSVVLCACFILLCSG